MDINKVQHIIKLSQNENPYGPSPKAIEAVKNNCDILNCYPEPHSHTLKSKIALRLNCHTDNVFVSAGLVESLDILIRNFVADDENIIFPELSFVAYKLLADVFQKEARLAKMNNYHVDVDEILKLYNNKTKVILIANPNNPTGTVISETQLLKILNHVAPTTLVVMDEAYIEYCNFKEYPDCIKLQKEYPNLIVMRTFSKIYGLAGLRVGYTIAAKELIEKFDYYQAPFTVNQIAAVAASEAFDDNEFIQMSSSSNFICREKLMIKFEELGFNVVPSESNFLFVHFDTKEERDFIYDQMEKKKVLIRKTDLFGEEKAFRISIGKPEMNELVMHCISSISHQ